MGTHGGTCPSSRILEQLLTEQLAGQERDSVESHVERCSECQTLLESMVASTRVAQLPARQDLAQANPEPSEEFLSRLRRLSPLSSRAGGVAAVAALGAAPPDPAWREGDRLGQYEILGTLGKGGMGAVFKARHTELGKVVALKMLRSERADEVMLARFKNEIRAVGSLDHPNIVVAHDAGQSGGTHFLVMEYVDGMDLNRLVERSGPLDPADACEVIRQAAVGLQHAYERGLVHRDVKPSNLMLARDGRVRVLDLGLARSFAVSAADKLTSHGMVLGTADYLAPEQWKRPHDADTRADIYSLGCSLYHLLAGAAPFADTSYGTVLGKMDAHQRIPPPIQQYCPNLPAGLAAVLSRMLAKDPADRFATPGEAAEALQPFTAGCDLPKLLDSVNGAEGSEQKPDVRRSKGVPPAGRWSAGWVVGSSLLILCLLAAIPAIIAPLLSRMSRPGAAAPPAPGAPDSGAITPLAIEEFRVNQFRGKQAKPLGDLRDSAEEIRINDSVRLFARLSMPAYGYLIAFNPDGSEQLCHPAWEGDHPQEARAARPEPVTEIRFFPDDKGMFGLDAAGLQVFVLAASSRPLPPYSEWRSAAGAIPWKPVGHGGDWRWLFDGRVFTRLPTERGKRNEREAQPRVLNELCAFFRDRSEFQAIQVIAFPVVNANPVSQLDAKCADLCREGKFVEAQEPIRQKIALLAREKGEKHFETEDTRRSLQTLQRVAALPEEARSEFARSYRVYDDMSQLVKKGKYREALPLAKENLDIRRRVLGPEHEVVAVATVEYAQLLHYSGRYKEAEGLFRKALATVRRLGGDKHPAVGKVSGDLAMNLDAQDRYAESQPFYEADVKIIREAYGENHPSTAIAINNLASHFERQALFADAEPLYRQSLDILLRAEGEQSRRVGIARNNIAYNLGQQGKYAQAEALYRQVLQGRRRLWGEEHPDTAISYSNLAVNLDEQGRHAEAEWLYHKALQITRRAFGEDSSKTAICLNNVAMNLQHQRKYEEAAPYFRESLEIHGRAAPGGSRNLAGVHHNFAANLQGQGQYEAAREELERALQIHRKLLGDHHPDVAQDYVGIAALFSEQKRDAEAEPLVRRAVERFQKKLGPEHPRTVQAKLSLANYLHNQGKFSEAEPLLKECLETLRRVTGEGHPGTTLAYLNRVSNLWAQGKYGEIDKLAPAAAASFEVARPGLSAAGLDRASRTVELSPLLNYLAAAAARNGHATRAWQYLESRLARGLFDELSAHPLTDAERDAERALLTQINQLNDRIAALVAPQQRRADAGAEADKLRAARDAVQVRLAGFRTELAAKYGAAAGKIYDLRHIQERLPPDAALVAWVDVAGDPKFRHPDGAHWACAVRRRGDPLWVQLTGTGAGGVWCAEDEKLAPKLREALADRGDVAKRTEKDLVAKLYAQRMGPLEPYLDGRDGLPRVRHLIILPANVMAGIPVEALTDRFVISYAPSGTTFVWLQDRSDAPRGGSRPDGSSLLAVGDPALPTSESGDAKSAPRVTSFTRLPAAGKEVRAVARVFAHAELLTDSEANEPNLERLANAGELRKFRFIHFATHGLVDDRRALNSALVLAQDRTTPGGPAAENRQSADGRLTADAILRGWKLEADLVTLSACETALGKFSGGEGYLGFSQALFLAGARATVLSLWRVDDRATALLMTRFYENMLGMPEGGVARLTKARALAEAKQWLRSLSADDVERLTADLPKGMPAGTRGVRTELPVPGTTADVPHPFEHPYYWSAFILIGDPR